MTMTSLGWYFTKQPKIYQLTPDELQKVYKKKLNNVEVIHFFNFGRHELSRCFCSVVLKKRNLRSFLNIPAKNFQKTSLAGERFFENFAGKKFSLPSKASLGLLQFDLFDDVLKASTQTNPILIWLRKENRVRWLPLTNDFFRAKSFPDQSYAWYLRSSPFKLRQIYSKVKGLGLYKKKNTITSVLSWSIRSNKKSKVKIFKVKYFFKNFSPKPSLFTSQLPFLSNVWLPTKLSILASLTKSRFRPRLKPAFSNLPSFFSNQKAVLSKKLNSLNTCQTIFNRESPNQFLLENKQFNQANFSFLPLNYLKPTLDGSGYQLAKTQANRQQLLHLSWKFVKNSQALLTHLNDHACYLQRMINYGLFKINAQLLTNLRTNYQIRQKEEEFFPSFLSDFELDNLMRINKKQFYQRQWEKQLNFSSLASYALDQVFPFKHQSDEEHFQDPNDPDLHFPIITEFLLEPIVTNYTMKKRLNQQYGFKSYLKALGHQQGARNFFQLLLITSKNLTKQFLKLKFQAYQLPLKQIYEKNPLIEKVYADPEAIYVHIPLQRRKVLYYPSLYLTELSEKIGLFFDYFQNQGVNYSLPQVLKPPTLINLPFHFWKKFVHKLRIDLVRKNQTQLGFLTLADQKKLKSPFLVDISPETSEFYDYTNYLQFFPQQVLKRIEENFPVLEQSLVYAPESFANVSTKLPSLPSIYHLQKNLRITQNLFRRPVTSYFWSKPWVKLKQKGTFFLQNFSLNPLTRQQTFFQTIPTVKTPYQFQNTRCQPYEDQYLVPNRNFWFKTLNQVPKKSNFLESFFDFSTHFRPTHFRHGFEIKCPPTAVNLPTFSQKILGSVNQFQLDYNNFLSFAENFRWLKIGNQSFTGKLPSGQLVQQFFDQKHRHIILKEKNAFFNANDSKSQEFKTFDQPSLQTISRDEITPAIENQNAKEIDQVSSLSKSILKITDQNFSLSEQNAPTTGFLARYANLTTKKNQNLKLSDFWQPLHRELPVRDLINDHFSPLTVEKFYQKLNHATNLSSVGRNSTLTFPLSVQAHKTAQPIKTFKHDLSTQISEPEDPLKTLQDQTSSITTLINNLPFHLSHQDFLSQTERSEVKSETPIKTELTYFLKNCLNDFFYHLSPLKEWSTKNQKTKKFYTETRSNEPNFSELRELRTLSTNENLGWFPTKLVEPWVVLNQANPPKPDLFSKLRPTMNFYFSSYRRSPFRIRWKPHLDSTQLKSIPTDWSHAFFYSKVAPSSFSLKMVDANNTLLEQNVEESDEVPIKLIILPRLIKNNAPQTSLQNLQRPLINASPNLDFNMSWPEQKPVDKFKDFEKPSLKPFFSNQPFRPLKKHEKFINKKLLKNFQQTIFTQYLNYKKEKVDQAYFDKNNSALNNNAWDSNHNYQLMIPDLTETRFKEQKLEKKKGILTKQDLKPLKPETPNKNLNQTLKTEILSEEKSPTELETHYDHLQSWQSKLLFIYLKTLKHNKPETSYNDRFYYLQQAAETKSSRASSETDSQISSEINNQTPETDSSPGSEATSVVTSESNLQPASENDLKETLKDNSETTLQTDLETKSEPKIELSDTVPIELRTTTDSNLSEPIVSTKNENTYKSSLEDKVKSSNEFLNSSDLETTSEVPLTSILEPTIDESEVETNLENDFENTTEFRLEKTFNSLKSTWQRDFETFLQSFSLVKTELSQESNRFFSDVCGPSWLKFFRPYPLSKFSPVKNSNTKETSFTETEFNFQNISWRFNRLNFKNVNAWSKLKFLRNKLLRIRPQFKRKTSRSTLNGRSGWSLQFTFKKSRHSREFSKLGSLPPRFSLVTPSVYKKRMHLPLQQFSTESKRQVQQIRLAQIIRSFQQNKSNRSVIYTFLPKISTMLNLLAKSHILITESSKLESLPGYTSRAVNFKPFDHDSFTFSYWQQNPFLLPYLSFLNWSAFYQQLSPLHHLTHVNDDWLSNTGKLNSNFSTETGFTQVNGDFSPVKIDHKLAQKRFKKRENFAPQENEFFINQFHDYQKFFVRPLPSTLATNKKQDVAKLEAIKQQRELYNAFFILPSFSPELQPEYYRRPYDGFTPRFKTSAGQSRYRVTQPYYDNVSFLNQKINHNILQGLFNPIAGYRYFPKKKNSFKNYNYLFLNKLPEIFDESSFYENLDAFNSSSGAKRFLLLI